MEKFLVNSILITGAGRGIGLKFVQELVALPHPPKHIFVTCRKPEAAVELQELAGKAPCVHISKFDVLDFDSYPKLVEWVESQLNGQGLNVLLNNAAVKLPADCLLDVSPQTMMAEFNTNTIAPLMMCKAFLPLLKKAATLSDVSGMSVSKSAIVNMSTMMASISENTGGGVYPYRASKVGLNMITKSLSVDLRDDKILAVALHPGWVLTDMGGPNALIDSQTSVKGILQVLSTLQEKDSGKFIKYNGDILPW